MGFSWEASGSILTVHHPFTGRGTMLIQARRQMGSVPGPAAGIYVPFRIGVEVHARRCGVLEVTAMLGVDCRWESLRLGAERSSEIAAGSSTLRKLQLARRAPIVWLTPDGDIGEASSSDA